MIIDGVDVSGCKYFDCGYKECKAEYYVRYGYEIEKYDSCRENPNCYFKQLKRAEQKLEKIKEYCNSCNLKADFTACDILQIIEGNENE